MSQGLYRTLFPLKFRYIPHHRTINITLRSLHIVCFSVLVGGHFFNQPADQIMPWLYATLITGGLMMLIELYGSFTFLIELRGLSVIFKTLLLTLIPFFWDSRFLILAVIIIIASITSHMRGKYRHISLISESRLDELRGY